MNTAIAMARTATKLNFITYQIVSAIYDLNVCNCEADLWTLDLIFFKCYEFTLFYWTRGKNPEKNASNF